MSSKFRVCLSFILLFGVTLTAASRPLAMVFLIPGILASSSHNFSDEIFSVFQERGFQVGAVDHFRWLGRFEVNGEMALSEIRKSYLENFPQRDVPLILVGHSAGGLVSLYVAMHAADLPISEIVTISTPLDGSEIAEKIASLPSVGSELINGIEALDPYVFIGELSELTTDRVREYLGEIKLKPEIKVFAIAGSAPQPSQISDYLRAEYLSPFFSFLANEIGSESDGVVSVRSASGKNVQSLPVEFRPEIHFALEHPRQTLDYRIFSSIGVLESEKIRNEQRRFYELVTKLLRDYLW